MSLTFPAAFCFVNSADTATISVAGALAGTPASRLQNQHTSVRCRVEATSMAVVVDLGSGMSIDTFGLFGIGGVGLTAASRVRASLTDATGSDGAVYDSTSATGRISPYYNALVCLKDGAGTARYVRFDVSQAAVSYVEAGFVMIGLRNQVGINFVYGSTDTLIDPSIRTKARSMATHVDTRNKYRRWNFNFELISDTERYGWVEDLDQLCGTSRNVMMIRKVDSTNLGRDTICGLITEIAPTVTRNGFLSATAVDAFSKAYNLEQRL